MRKTTKLYNVAIFSVIIVFIMTMFGTLSKIFHRDDPVTPPETTSVTSVTPDVPGATEPESTTQAFSGATFSYGDIPSFSGEPYYVVNDNVPFFTPAEETLTVFETYSELDGLGRCGAAYANVCKELMPTESRGDIGSVKPSGWTYNGKSNNNRYEYVDGWYVYNRCHLIGFQLTGENDNKKNLITGTRYLNVDGMLPFENMVADYVKATDNHVLYRVTPVFLDSEPVCRGVLMEAYSVEDKGEGIEFNVWCYNVQPGVVINYQTGQNTDLNTAASATEPAVSGYVVNDNSMKFHLTTCKYASVASANQRYVSDTRDSLISEGYAPCKVCDP